MIYVTLKHQAANKHAARPAINKDSGGDNARLFEIQRVSG